MCFNSEDLQDFILTRLEWMKKYEQQRGCKLGKSKTLYDINNIDPELNHINAFYFWSPNNSPYIPHYSNSLMCVINACRWQKTRQMYTSLSFELATFWLTHMHKSGTIISSSNKIWNETALFNCKGYQSEHTTNICFNLKSCLVHKRNGLPCFQLRE